MVSLNSEIQKMTFFSMRRKKEIMENYSPVKTNPMANGGGGGFYSSTSSSAANQASKTLPRRNQQQNRNGTGTGLNSPLF